MTEKELENRLAETIRKAAQDPNALHDVPIQGSMNPAITTLYGLIGDAPFDLFQDTSDWNPNPKFMIDVACNTVPDLVIRSKASGENRIYIEVKLHQEISNVAPLSQVVRQFLHLLCTSRYAPLRDRADIRRAILIAAPSAWFER